MRAERTTASILAFAILPLCSYAQLPECSSPPYGDTRNGWVVAQSGLKSLASSLAADSGRSPQMVMDSDIRETLRDVCEFKAGRDTGFETQLRDVGIAMDDAANESPLALAIHYLGVTLSLDEFHRDAKRLSVSEFELQGPDLVQRHAKITVSGAYVREGSTDNLYSNAQAAIAARYSPNLGAQPYIPLMLDHALMFVRQRLQQCRADPAATATGCQVSLGGIVSMCVQTNAFGAERQVPCLNVWDYGFAHQAGSHRQSTGSAMPPADPNPGAEPPK